MPTARDLRDRVRFERRTETPDGYGNTVAGWATLFERWAALKPTTPRKTGSEEVLQARRQGVAFFDLWVRHDSQTVTITPADRVVDARDPTRIFDIQFNEDMDGRRTWRLLQLQKGANPG